MTTIRSFAGVLETLEPRLAPAGVVTITTAGGVLTITGDGGHNVIHITDLPDSGEWQISDPTVSDCTVRGNLTLNTGAGEDYVYLNASDGGTNAFFGAVRIVTGANADQVELGTSGTNQFYRQVFIDCGAGTDTLTEGDNQFLAGSVLTKAGVET
ncbi:MAG TPA: hypothetical protein VD994_09895 [Prosthecobacter sp.]|nr:hypothetical protein [Prosthecobacter sp.]